MIRSHMHRIGELFLCVRVCGGGGVHISGVHISYTSVEKNLFIMSFCGKINARK